MIWRLCWMTNEFIGRESPRSSPAEGLYKSRMHLRAILPTLLELSKQAHSLHSAQQRPAV
jgi:hypothetical protein